MNADVNGDFYWSKWCEKKQLLINQAYFVPSTDTLYFANN